MAPVMKLVEISMEQGSLELMLFISLYSSR